MRQAWSLLSSIQPCLQYVIPLPHTHRGSSLSSLTWACCIHRLLSLAYTPDHVIGLYKCQSFISNLLCFLAVMLAFLLVTGCLGCQSSGSLFLLGRMAVITRMPEGSYSRGSMTLVYKHYRRGHVGLHVERRGQHVMDMRRWEGAALRVLSALLSGEAYCTTS